MTLTLFVLAFNFMGFAEGYLLRDFGLVWLLPILAAPAYANAAFLSTTRSLQPAPIRQHRAQGRQSHGQIERRSSSKNMKA